MCIDVEHPCVLMMRNSKPGVLYVNINVDRVRVFCYWHKAP